MITTLRLHSSPRHALLNIKYRNRLRLKCMMLSGSRCHPLKQNSALLRQRPSLFQISKSVSPTLKCPDSKCKLSSMQTARRWGGCYSQKTNLHRRPKVLVPRTQSRFGGATRWGLSCSAVAAAHTITRPSASPSNRVLRQHRAKHRGSL